MTMRTRGWIAIALIGCSSARVRDPGVVRAHGERSTPLVTRRGPAVPLAPGTTSITLLNPLSCYDPLPAGCFLWNPVCGPLAVVLLPCVALVAVGDALAWPIVIAATVEDRSVLDTLPGDCRVEDPAVVVEEHLAVGLAAGYGFSRPPSTEPRPPEAAVLEVRSTAFTLASRLRLRVEARLSDPSGAALWSDACDVEDASSWRDGDDCEGVQARSRSLGGSCATALLNALRGAP